MCKIYNLRVKMVKDRISKYWHDHGYLSYIIDRYNDLPDFVFTKVETPSRKYYKCLSCKQNY